MDNFWIGFEKQAAKKLEAFLGRSRNLTDAAKRRIRRLEFAPTHPNRFGLLADHRRLASMSPHDTHRLGHLPGVTHRDMLKEVITDSSRFRSSNV